MGSIIFCLSSRLRCFCIDFMCGVMTNVVTLSPYIAQTPFNLFPLLNWTSTEFKLRSLRETSTYSVASMSYYYEVSSVIYDMSERSDQPYTCVYKATFFWLLYSVCELNTIDSSPCSTDISMPLPILRTTIPTTSPYAGKWCHK